MYPPIHAATMWFYASFIMPLEPCKKDNNSRQSQTELEKARHGWGGEWEKWRKTIYSSIRRQFV